MEAQLADGDDSTAVTTVERIPAGLRWVSVLGWAWFFVALPFVTDAGPNFFAFLFLFYSGASLGALWVAATLVCHRGLASRRGIIRWCATPFAGVLALCLLMSDWPLKARLALCESSLREYVTQEAAKGDDWDHHGLRLVGTFLVTETRRYDGTVFLVTGGFIDSAGLAFVPPGKDPPSGSRVHLEPIYGPWYRFVWRF